MKAKDIIAKLEEFDPEIEVAILADRVYIAGRPYEKWNHNPEFTDFSG